MFSLRNWVTGLIAVFVATIMMVGTASASQALRDPTQPIGYDASGAKKRKMKLQAIYFSDSRREAVISGQSLSEGDYFDGAQIKKIEAGKVLLNKNGQNLVLHLRTSIFKP